MGKYTILDDPRVDKYIDNHLEKVIDILFKNIPRSSIRSILLGGSFGKGEGSVLVDSQGIKPLRDFDLCVIFREKAPPEDLINAIRKRLEDRFCFIRDPDYHLLGDLIPEISATTLENINSLPDIASYDLKKRGRILYGEDVRPQIKWELEDLPLRTNGRALFQKAIALIGSFHAEYLSGNVPLHLRSSFIRETSRAYIEICVGLCLLAKQYNSSCIERLATIRKIYREEFPELHKRIPDLVDKIEESTKYRLDPANNTIDIDPVDYWFRTRDDLGEAIKHYFGRYLGISFQDWMQFSKSLEISLTQEYYLPVIKAYLKQRNLPASHLILKLSNLLFNIKENTGYSRQAIGNRHVSMPLLYGISSPVIKVFSTAPLVLFSINRHGKANSVYVDTALRKLGFVKPEKNKRKAKWEEARSKLLNVVFSVNMI